MEENNNSLKIHQKPKYKLIGGIPSQYYENQQLTKALTILPRHYNFQMYKVLYRIQTISKELQINAMRVALQFPEGLMMFACLIADLLKAFAVVQLQIIILGDLTYGACCIDDIVCDKMKCHLLVHYGHSCLVPITQTRGKVLYVFVQMNIDIVHFVETIQYNFSEMKLKTVYLMGTIQFNSSLFLTKQQLIQRGFKGIVIPQEKPRSSGQILGCTSPKLELTDHNVIIFLCDGRFHMEAAMIANPGYTFYQYDPYTRKITQQRYDNNLMIKHRAQQISKISDNEMRKVCFILGTLGRQGNPAILQRLIKKIENKFKYMVLLASQISNELLGLLDVDFYVQIACPRLSIDWAYGTTKPMLTPFELYALMDSLSLQDNYSMDYYSHNGGPWSNYYGKAKKHKATHEAKIKLETQKEKDEVKQ